MGKKIVFLDRDGVINKLIERDGRMVSPRTFADFEVLPEVPWAIRRLRELEFEIIVVTNQPDISRGLMKLNELERMHKLVRSLGVQEVKYCPHTDDDDCTCRKPKSGMLTSYLSSLDSSDYQAWMVGDEDRDIEAGRNAGIPAVSLIRICDTNDEQTPAHVKNLNKAVNIIIGSQASDYGSDQN